MYALFNKSNKKYLIHPSIGLWNGTEQEATDMRNACVAYLKTIDVNMADDIKIVELPPEK